VWVATAELDVAVGVLLELVVADKAECRKRAVANAKLALSNIVNYSNIFQSVEEDMIVEL